MKLVIKMAVNPESTVVNKTGGWRTFMPVFDHKFCTKCGICAMYCPDGVVYELDDHFAPDYDYCKGCGICANECPQKAIEMVLDKR